MKIKDEKLLIKTKNKVSELVEKIINLKKHYDNPHNTYSDPDYIQELANHHHHHLKVHLDKNRIIYNVFHDFRLLNAKVFKGFLESYLTKGAGLVSFHSSYLIDFIIYVTPSDFKKLLINIDSLKLNKTSSQDLIDTINNLFTSYYNTSISFFSSIKNRIIEEYLIDYGFNERYRSLISNSFVILSKVEFEQECGCLPKSIVEFLSIEDILYWNELEEFTKLIEKKGNLFTQDQLFKLLEIVVENNKPNNNKYEGLIQGIPKAINKFYPEFQTNNIQLIKRALSTINNNRKWKYISYLLLISNRECQDIINSEIEITLDKEMDFDIYDYLIRKKLFDHKRKGYFKKYVEIIKTSKEVGFTNKFENKKPIFKGHTFYNFIILINILGIDKDSDILKGFDNVSNYEKWLLNPEKYDYSKFDPKWILASDNIYIFNSLKGIENLSISIEKELKANFNSTLSEIYYNHLL